MGTFSRERNKPAPDWPNLQNNLSEGRFCFENLDIVKPNPDNACAKKRPKGKAKGLGKGRGHLCGAAEDIVNLFGLLWISSAQRGSGRKRQPATRPLAIHRSYREKLDPNESERQN